MTQKLTLKKFLKSTVIQSTEIFNEINKKEPLKQKIEKHYEFKNDFFNKEIKNQKNDFKEFFSRKNVKSEIEKIKDFDDAVDILSRYPTEIFSKRDLNAKSVLHSFIENYVYHVRDFKYDYKEFEYIFKSFINFLDFELSEVHYFVPLFQLFFSSRYEQKKFGDLKLSKISQEQFKIIKESLVGNQSTPGYLRKLRYVLETTVSLKDNPEEEDRSACERFTQFLNVCRLFSEGNVQLGPIYKNYTFWTINSSKILNMRDIQLDQKNIKLNTTSYSNLKKFYDDFCNVDLDNKDWSFIQIAIDRFSSSLSRSNPVDKIVDLNVALECLFSSIGETSLKISNRTAMIISSNENEQERYWNFIKNTYNLRNDILHGRKGNDYDVSVNVKELEGVIRISIRKFLNLTQNLSKDELKSEDKLTHGKKIREYILDELDSGLINRLKLENFRKKLSGSFD